MWSTISKLPQCNRVCFCMSLEGGCIFVAILHLVSCGFGLLHIIRGFLNVESHHPTGHAFLIAHGILTLALVLVISSVLINVGLIKAVKQGRLELAKIWLYATPIIYIAGLCYGLVLLFVLTVVYGKEHDVLMSIWKFILGGISTVTCLIVVKSYYFEEQDKLTSQPTIKV